jgi:long-chain fatty acid transport protein
MRSVLLAGVVAGLLAAIPSASADSFAINEYSTRDLGLANAGRATQRGDAAAAWGNPALIAALRRGTVTGSLSGILGDSQFDDRGSIDLLSRPLGGDTRGFLENALVPGVQAAWPINDRMAVGLAITAPFGLATEYESNWPGRYQALKSSLRTVDINPSFSWQITDSFAVGVGVSAQYAKATLNSMIDFGAVCLSRLAPASCAGLGLLPQAADGFTEIEGDSWEWGWNVGAAWSPTPDWTIGLTYRSGVDHTLEGDAKFVVPTNAAILTSTGAFTDTPGSAELNLPDMAELGVRWQTNPQLALYAAAQWKQWSNLAELRVDFENPAQPDSVEELNYEDSWRYSFGVEYQIEPQWMLRAGLAFDGSPTQPEFRTARIPDNDRMVYAVGASWTPNDDWSVDFAYNRIQIDDTEFDHVGNFNDRVTGEYTGHANVISVGATRRF